jgi:hypothetical protein
MKRCSGVVPSLLSITYDTWEERNHCFAHGRTANLPADRPSMKNSI